MAGASTEPGSRPRPRRLSVEPAAFSAAEVERAWAELEASELVGPSVLRGGFAATRGFGAIFRREGAARLGERLPAVRGFLARTLAGTDANAFYLNLLVVPPGVGVGAHEDGTLTSFLGLERGPPLRVSVLYLVPPEAGGALVLRRRLGWPTRVRPTAGMLLHFRGDLVHAVEPVDASASRARVSLVLEQYEIPEDRLEDVPSCHLESRERFARLLARARDRA